MERVCTICSGHEATRIGETRPSLLGAGMPAGTGLHWDWSRHPENYQLTNQWPVVCGPLTYRRAVVPVLTGRAEHGNNRVPREPSALGATGWWGSHQHVGGRWAGRCRTHSRPAASRSSQVKLLLWPAGGSPYLIRTTHLSTFRLRAPKDWSAGRTAAVRHCTRASSLRPDLGPISLSRPG